MEVVSHVSGWLENYDLDVPDCVEYSYFRVRKLGRRIRTEELEEFHFNISDASEDSHEDDLKKLQWAIRQLTEIERGMIMMALDEVPYEEIAETIGITQNNVRVRMNRIRDKLRKLMS